MCVCVQCILADAIMADNPFRLMSRLTDTNVWPILNFTAFIGLANISKVSAALPGAGPSCKEPPWVATDKKGQPLTYG